MNSIFSMWLLHFVLLVLGLSFVVRGIPIEPFQQLANELSLSSAIQVLPALSILEVKERTTTSGSESSISTSLATSSSSTDASTSSSQASTSSTGILTSSTSSIITSTKSASFISTPPQLKSVSGTTTSISATQSTTAAPSSSTTSSSSSSSDKRTLTIALSVTFSILGTIALILITLLLIQCTKSSPSYQRFRFRLFPLKRGGATPLSDNEIASWREKPLSPPGHVPHASYANLIQRYSRPLSFTRPLASNPVHSYNLSQQQRTFPLKSETSRPSINRPAAPPKLVLTGGGNGPINSNRIPLKHPYSVFPTPVVRTGEKDVVREREQRSAPLPPIARAPNSRPGLTDESLPGTPAFILPTHPRRVSRKLSKTNGHSAFSPGIGSVTSPSTPRPSTSNSGGFGKGKRRRRSMPGLRGEFMSGAGNRGDEWTPKRCEEDPVVQRGTLGLCDGGGDGGGLNGVHSRSRSDMTPFKEAMEGRSRPSAAVRPSFEESLGRVREEAPT